MKTSSALTLALTLLVCSQVPAYAQVQQSWVQRFATSASEIPVAMKTNGGSVYVLAVTNRFTSAANAMLIKYSSAGAFQWAQTYNGPANNQDTPSDLALDAAGNIYVIGSSTVIVGNSSFAETFTLKYNSSGNLLWASRYRRTDNYSSDLNAVAVDGSGNVYVTGSTIAGAPFAYDFMTIKYNSLGVQQWIRTYNGTGNGTDMNTRIALDNGGNIYVTGESVGQTRKGRLTLNTFADFYTIKYDPGGNTLWARRYATSRTDRPKALVVDAAASVYITGESSNGSNNDFLTVKYDVNGAFIWAARHNGPANGHDGAQAIVATTAGECFVTGYSDPGGGSSMYNYKTIRYNSAGIPVWEQSYNGAVNGHDRPTSIGIDHYGSVYVTGESQGIYGADFATVKYSSSGVQSWVATYNGTGYGYDAAAAIAVSIPSGPVASNATIYVAGESLGTGTGADAVVIKYTQPLVIGGFASTMKVSNYPNPFVSSTTIEYELPEDSDVSVQVIDVVSGNELETISLGRQSAGKQSYDYQPRFRRSGNYVYRLITESASGRSVQSNLMQIER